MRVRLNEDIVFLFYLAEVYRINFEALLHLYEKYGTEVFFIFYIFSDMRINFPSTTKMQKMKERASNFLVMLQCQDPKVFKVKQEQEVYEALVKRCQKTPDGLILEVAKEDIICPK